MTRGLVRLFSCLALILALALPGGAGVARAPGQDGEKAPPAPGPVLEAKIPVKIEKPAAAPARVTLEPFFLISEEASRVRVRRIMVALEFGQPAMPGNFNPQAPRLRELVYDFLAAKEQGHSGRYRQEQEKVLAGLVNRYLGQEAVSAIKVDQTFLLLH